MTTKTIKTILFASLIAALILPFSAMDFADAVTSTEKTISKAEKIQQSIDELIASKAQPPDDVVNEQIDDQINTLKIAKKLANLEAKGLESSPKAQNLVAELVEKIDSKGVAIESSMSSELPSQAFEFAPYNARTDRYITSEQSTQSCGNTAYGQATGSLLQYDTSSLWSMTTVYPFDLQCDKKHNESQIRISDLSVSSLPNCDAVIPRAIGSVYVICEDFGLADNVLTITTILVTTNAYYENGALDIPFTATPGWALIVY